MYPFDAFGQSALGAFRTTGFEARYSGSEVFGGYLEIRALADDYLECVEPDTAGSPIYYVAKPLGVRMSRASHGDLTFTYADSNTRTATSGDTTEAQTLVEPYVAADLSTSPAVPGDQIFAATPIAGGTGVVKDGAELVWQEMLNTPRWWAVAD